MFPLDALISVAAEQVLVWEADCNGPTEVIKFVRELATMSGSGCLSGCLNLLADDT